MTSRPERQRQSFIVERHDLDFLLQELSRQEYEVVGPTISRDAIIYDRVSSASDLPVGWTDEQDAGRYRLTKRNDQAVFGYTVGPNSWKRYLFPSNLRLWKAERHDRGFKILHEDDQPPKYAFIGVRPCEIKAIDIQDKVFLQGKYTDHDYQARREGIFIVAVNCTQAGGTCFCVSMNTGPKATSGYDLSLTEVVEEGSHTFVVEVGTEKGQKLLARLPHREASPEERSKAEDRVQRTAESMGRTMDTSNIKGLLYQSYEHSRWDDVASRCLTCTKCTMVCPTCFCSTTTDDIDLSGQTADRVRRWDSCFTVDFSYIHGGSVRQSAKARYRQWLTHKLASWIDQFGTSGCVGCGRCITWCPVGIDITEEVRVIRESQEPSTSRAGDRSSHAT